MNIPWVQCLGCNKVFTPGGLSQHRSKTQQARCHNTDLLNQQRVVSRSGPQNTGVLTQNSASGSCDINSATRDNEYHLELHHVPDDEVIPTAQPGQEDIRTATTGDGKLFPVMRASH